MIFLAAGVLLAACVLVGYGIRVARQRSQENWSLRRILVGGAVLLTAVVTGVVLMDVKVEEPPEQRGIGVVIAPAGSPDAYLANDLIVAAAVEVHSCGEPVSVRLTLAPTAEFWIANGQGLRNGASVTVAVPGPAVTDVVAALAGDGLEPILLPQTGLGDLEADSLGSVETDRVHHASLLRLDVPKWGRSTRPLVVTFESEWTQRRSFLGGCYVTLPALVGMQTSLSGSQAAGLAAAGDEPLPTDAGVNVLVVEATDDGLSAFYQRGFEITRGVTTLSLGSYALEGGESLPAPDANIGGSAAWTCASTLTGSFDFADAVGPDAAPPDLLMAPDQQTFSISAERIAEILDQQTCASFVAIEASSAGTRRDVLLLVIGAAFSLGLEFLLSGMAIGGAITAVRRRPAKP